MASLIEGYSCDIFISYRQKDNNRNGWVTEFVENLKGELESTFREEISVYFDNNPDDGLLETHDVDASLQEKLKCLIFIPIISRTYCDPNSFAFKHEFKSFVVQASTDRFGLKVKLPNGNVAGRVLPVRIHDLKKEDISLCEEVLGSPLRGVEFIYKSSGVSRPLTANEDHIHDNLNKTYYRDQINKVGRSIQEIVDAMISADGDAVPAVDQAPGEVTARHSSEKPSRRKYSKYVIPLFLITALSFLLFSVKPFKNIFSNHRGEEIIDRAISVIDPLNAWADYSGKVKLRNIRINAENEFTEIIEIGTKSNYYKRTFIFDTLKSVTGFENERYFGYNIKINGDTTYDINLADSNFYKETKFMRRHHFCQFGLLMELKKSGLVMNDKVKKEEFRGNRQLALHFTSAGSDNEDEYFRGSKWTVYVDPSNYSMTGYKFENPANNLYWDIVLLGNVRINNLNVPLCKVFYNRIDNSLIWMDIMTPEN